MAGAEWVLKNLDNGIDFQKSLEKLRESCIERQRTEDEVRRRALHIHSSQKESTKEISHH